MAHHRAMQVKAVGTRRAGKATAKGPRKVIEYKRQGTVLTIPDKLRLSLLFKSKSGRWFRVYFKTHFGEGKQAIVHKIVNGKPGQKAGVRQASNVLTSVIKIYGETLMKQHYWNFLKTL